MLRWTSALRSSHRDNQAVVAGLQLTSQEFSMAIEPLSTVANVTQAA
jgi:hypothetical protein